MKPRREKGCSFRDWRWISDTAARFRVRCQVDVDLLGVRKTPWWETPAVGGRGGYQLILSPGFQVNKQAELVHLKTCGEAWTGDKSCVGALNPESLKGGSGMEEQRCFLLELNLIALINCQYIQLVLHGVNYTHQDLLRKMVIALLLLYPGWERADPPQSTVNLCF